MTDSGTPNAGRMNRTLTATAAAVAVATPLLALLALLVGWPRWAGERLDKVVVSWAGPPKCTGTQVESREGHGSAPEVVARPSMHCVITVRITNRGKHEVTVTRLIAPFLGHETGTAFIAAPLSGVEPRSEPTFGVDAIYDLDTRLAGGATQTMQVAFVFNKTRRSPAGHFSVYNWPLVEVSALGKSEKRASSETLHVRDFAKFHHCRSS